MIKYFSVENFRSIKKENILEFDTGLNKGTTFISNPVIGFAGANASGKTTVLQAITFLLWFMKDSFFNIGEEENIPIVPFCTNSNYPIHFHIIFAKKTIIDDQERYVDYEYKLSLTTKNVLSEFLYYYPYKRKRIAYIREGNLIEFGNSINHPSRGVKEFKKDLRTNCSIISYAAQYPSQKTAINCQNYSFLSNVVYSGMKELKFDPGLLDDLLKNRGMIEKIREYLKIADLGITDISYKKLHRNKIEKIIKATKEPDEESRKNLPEKLIKNLDILKGKSDLEETGILFEHNIDKEKIFFDQYEESSGTLKFLTVLYQVFHSLKNGSVLILDEIEFKMHQNLVSYLIGLFKNEFENNNDAQLIFSFHNSSFMKILTPEQLWFTEKNDYGHTEIFSASHFEDITKLHDKNLELLYRIGRFGAKPRGI